MKRELNPITQKILDNLEVMPSVGGAVQMFNVQKNQSGDLFVEMIRKALHRGSYKLRVRGSLSDRKSLRKKGEYVSDESVKLDQADRYRIYIEDGGKKYGDVYWRQQFYKVTEQNQEYRKEIAKLNQAMYDASIKKRDESKPESMLLKITDKASFKALQRIAFKYNVGWTSSGFNIIDKDYTYVSIKLCDAGNYVMFQEFASGNETVYIAEYSLADVVEFLERVKA